MFGTKNTENTTCTLEGPCVDRVPRGVSLWSGVGKPGDLRDHPADKISARSDQGPEIRRICQPDHRDCCVPPIYGLFLDAILLYAPSGPLSDRCINRLTLGRLVAPSQVFCLSSVSISCLQFHAPRPPGLTCLLLLSRLAVCRASSPSLEIPFEDFAPSPSRDPLAPPLLEKPSLTKPDSQLGDSHVVFNSSQRPLHTSAGVLPWR